jgi:hypothetical protein
MFLRNVGVHPTDYTALYPRRLYSSFNQMHVKDRWFTNINYVTSYGNNGSLCSANWNVLERMRPWPLSRYCAGFRVEGLSKITKNLRVVDIQTRIRSRSLQNMPEAFPLEPTCFVLIYGLQVLNSVMNCFIASNAYRQ